MTQLPAVSSQQGPNQRVGRAMAQLQLEAEEGEPDSTVIDKMLERQLGRVQRH